MTYAGAALALLCATLAAAALAARRATRVDPAIALRQGLTTKHPKTTKKNL